MSLPSSIFFRGSPGHDKIENEVQCFVGTPSKQHTTLLTPLFNTKMSMNNQTMIVYAEVLEAQRDDLIAHAEVLEARAKAIRTLLATAAHEGPVKKTKRSKRVFSRLSSMLPYNSQVSIESCGDKWLAVFTENGFERNGEIYTSPTAICAAHASRITEKHPKKTMPGLAWEYIRVENGKSLAEIYDAAPAA